MTPLVARVVAPHMIPFARTLPLQTSKVHLGWLPPCFSQPAYMHAFLCLMALHLGIEQSGNPHYTTLAAYHRRRAIAIVQENLNDMNGATSDENIAAVFNLICVEETLFAPNFVPTPQLQPDISRKLIHLKGLREMVRLRGGVHALANNKSLQQIIIR